MSLVLVPLVETTWYGAWYVASSTSTTTQYLYHTPVHMSHG